MKVELLKLDNVQQFYFKCKPHGKIDFLKNIYDAFEKQTQTIIFVNTKKYADIVYEKLNQSGCRCFIMFGDLSKEDRDTCVKKFRDGIINVIISTNILSRGFDMQTIKLVINLDVPIQKGKPDYENYMHRIGRAGRFGNSGVALTLLEAAFFNIVDHYKINDKVKPLEGGGKQLSDIIHKAIEEDSV